MSPSLSIEYGEGRDPCYLTSRVIGVNKLRGLVQTLDAIINVRIPVNYTSFELVFRRLS